MTKVEQLQVKCFGLESDLEESDQVIKDLKDWKKLHEERITALERQLQKAKHSPLTRRPTLQEEVIAREAKQAEEERKAVEEKKHAETIKLRTEVEVLKQMMDKFEQPEYNAEDEKMASLTREIMKLISDKEDALTSAEEVKQEYTAKINNIASNGLGKDGKPSAKGKRRLSLCASVDPSFSAALRRASMSGDVNEQMKAEAKIEMLALETRLKGMDSEKSELLKELATMKAIIAAADGVKPGKKTERLVYQLSCRKCNKHMNFVGTTHDSIKTTMTRHFDEVYEATQNKDLLKAESRRGGSSVKSNGSTSKGPGNWNAEFAAHFAKHCKPAIRFKAITKKDVITFCRQNVKVEVLKRSDGAELYWEDEE